jgi:hypothetical protein
MRSERLDPIESGARQQRIGADPRLTYWRDEPSGFRK